MLTLKQKTITGLSWSFIDNIAVYGIQFVVGIVLARILSPEEFGLIGMVTIFIAISFSFIDSGFTQAIIRKNDATQIDYSTVFYFNIVASLLLYFILFISANEISIFFEEPKLEMILKFLGLGLIVDASAIVQRAKLTKQINFKLQTKISVIASVMSGIIGISMAYYGYGVWSLIIKMLIRQLLSSFLLWIWNKWKPTLEFSMVSFKEMFSFGSKLLVSGLIDVMYRNIYLLIIGKFFSATELGYYTRAKQFGDLASRNISGIVQRVSYPILATIQDDKPKLKAAYRRLIKSTMFITFFAMLSLASMAKPLILTLIGEKWLQSVIYLQLLCFPLMLYPLHAINLNAIKVVGRSDVFLKLEIINKLLAVPVIIIGISYGIPVLIISMSLLSLVQYFINSYYPGRLIGYSTFDQLKDIFPAFIFALFISSISFIIGYFLTVPYFVILLIQIAVTIFLFFVIGEALKNKDYLYLKQIVIGFLRPNLMKGN